MDRIEIEQIECAVRVGVPEQERSRPQRILVDVELELDLSSAAERDDLNETVDYRLLAEEIRRELESREFHLLEAVAGTVCRRVLSRQRVEAVTVVARKFPDVMRGLARSVSVHMKRSQGRCG